MDWSSVDLTSEYERDSNLLDAYSFDTILLEINCNLKEINVETVTEQFERVLSANVEEARSIFYSNLNNIVKQAKKERG